MTIKRIQVKETERIDDLFEGKLEDIIAQLQYWKNVGEWVGIEPECYQDYGVEYFLYKFREENDKEYAKRVKQLEKEKAARAKTKERKLQQLKKDLASLSDEEKEQLGVK